jgi:hypothetical protein
MPTTKIPMPPIRSTRLEMAGLVGTAVFAPLPAGGSIASPQWIQNFHVGATGDPQPTQVSITSDCMGVIFGL